MEQQNDIPIEGEENVGEENVGQDNEGQESGPSSSRFFPFYLFKR